MACLMSMWWKQIDYVEVAGQRIVAVHFSVASKILRQVQKDGGTNQFQFLVSLSRLNSFYPALHRCREVRVELWLAVLLEINGKSSRNPKLQWCTCSCMRLCVCSSSPLQCVIDEAIVRW